ncbi:MAG: glycoside hydrolase family 15 protein [Limisphaerales bacterium]
MGPYPPIENHGIIGDLATVALVGMDGSIDFMCFPKFDSPTIFGALLDHERGGRFQIAPVSGDFSQKQRYLPNTNILLTHFLGDAGMVEISDYMALCHLGHRHNLVRRVKLTRGEITLRMVCAPKFDYGRCGHAIEKRPGEILFIPERKTFPALRLRSSRPLTAADGAAAAEFKLRPLETAWFILEEAGTEGSRSENPAYVSEAFKETMNYWNCWSERSTYQGRWREMVNRSALALKLMTSLEHGSIVAAPTFGLPESIGGERNWDYRYTWVRDASFTLYALMRIGYTEEARAFLQWIAKRCQELKPDRPLQVMYRLDGGHELPESKLSHWEGYKKSRPVRIGNAASEQLQLDIYGELMDSVFIYDRHIEAISIDFWNNIARFTDWLCKHWTKPDNGIWEVRGGRKRFLYSRAMSWLAIERALKIAFYRSYPAPMARWRGACDSIFEYIHRKFWNKKLNAFVQYPGAKAFDASAFVLPLIKFFNPGDSRWQSTLEAMEKDLVEDSLVYRYHPDKAASDGMSGPESTFTVCSFWYAQCLARMGNVKQAQLMFEKMLGYANHLGLYAEQLGPRGEHLGNFPQAFTHLALISAAYNLDQKLSAPRG